MKDSSDWSAVVDCVAASVLIFDKTGRLISSNPAARDRLGTLGRIAEPNQFAAILAPTAEDDANQVLAALGANKSPQVFTALVADRAGQERPMRWTVARAIFSGSAAILVATGHDQPLENEIPRSESLDLRAIIDAVPVPIVLTRVSDGTIRYVNQATSQRIGITTEQFIGRRSPDFYANPAQRSEILARIKRDGHVDAIEIEFKDHTGRTFPALLSSCVMPIQGEAVLLSCIYDIAELKATERARSDSEARYRILAEKAQVGIVHLDASWNCTYANPAACRMLEVAEMPQIVGRSMIEFSTPESVPTIVQHRERRIRGESSSYEIDIVGSRGGRRSLLVSAAPLLGADGTLVGSLATYTDITELKDTHRALVRASERAEAASRAKSDFLARMSHELRTPLNAIIGFSEIIRDQFFGPVGSPRYTDYAGDIHRSGNHLLQIVNDILDLSKVEAGRVELADEVFAPDAAAREALAVMAGQADRRGLSMSADFPSNLPKLRADRRYVRQMLLNLLANAIKFTDRGGRVFVEGRRDGAALLIAVRDTGVGIAADDIPRALQPFGQIANPLVSDQGGTGLGLAVVRALIERHGGALELKSTLHKGTTATLVFPSARVVDR